MSINLETETPSVRDQKSAMEQMYRIQRHFYDATRAYYLLGRDQMIARLNPPTGGLILEIGCGTGRNLVHAMRRYSSCHPYGIDISDEMLKTACVVVERSGLQGMVRLAQADAAEFDPEKVLGKSRFDRIYFSYALSMIPDWEKALAHAATLLTPTGELHIVDFGTCDGLPTAAKHVLYAWLKAFDVTPRTNMRNTITRIANSSGCGAEFWSSHRGYAAHAQMTKQA